MPDVQVRLPNRMVFGCQQRAALMRAIQETVAAGLDCNDYDGEPIELTASDIDVQLLPYADSNVAFGAVVLVQIQGYDYPSRMNTITERLELIGKDICSLAPTEPGPEQKSIALTYVPLTRGCWVGV